MLLLIHERDESRDRSALIDALIVTMALATLLWVYLIAPYANEQTMPLLRGWPRSPIPAMDILVLGVVARMAAGSHRREPAFVFLLAGATVLLIADTIYGAKLLEGGYSTGAGMLGRLGGLLRPARARPPCTPRCGCSPSRARSSETGLTRARLALLACASLTVPLVIVLRRALASRSTSTS